MEQTDELRVLIDRVIEKIRTDDNPEQRLANLRASLAEATDDPYWVGLLIDGLRHHAGVAA